MIGSERLGLGSVPTAAGAGDGGAPPGTFVESVTGNRGVQVDNTDPQNPIVGLVTFPSITGYLAQLFALGVADNPATDNTLVGSYFNNFFATDGSIKITQKTSTNGVDSQTNPALTLTRKFTAAGISGLALKTVTQIDGTGLQSGGVWQQSYLKDTPGTEFEIVAHNDFWNPSLSPNYYDPAFSPLNNVGFSGLSLRDRAGAMQDVSLYSGDGNLTIAPRLPNDGLARIMGALFLDGSQDGLGMADGQGFGLWTFGRDDLGFREPMSRIDTYWIDSTFVGPIPGISLKIAQGGAWHEVLGLALNLATFPGDVDVAGTLNVATGLGGAGALKLREFVIESAEIDWLNTGGAYLAIPQASPIGNLTGKRVTTSTRQMRVTQLTGTVTGAPQWKAGNNGAHDNMQAAVAVGTGFNTATVGQVAAGGGPTFPFNAVDMTAGNIVLDVTSVATGVGLTVFKGKMVWIIMVEDLS